MLGAQLGRWLYRELVHQGVPPEVALVYGPKPTYGPWQQNEGRDGQLPIDYKPVLDLVAKLVRQHVEEQRAVTEHANISFAKLLLEQRLENSGLSAREHRRIAKTLAASSTEQLAWLESYLARRARALSNLPTTRRRAHDT
jgi:hypothetical protein